VRERREEAQLIGLAREGSPTAAARLVELHWSRAWKVAYAVTGHRALADDAAQEGVLRAMRALDTFDDRAPFWPWLKRIVVNRAIEELRHEQRLTTAERRYEELWGRFDNVTPGDSSGEIAAAVAGLTPVRRLVVVLHYWLDYSVEEIAAQLELPVGTVASRLSRALAQLRASLEEQHVR
jgi:RNA polymerase sigma-70 factor (ECF subfamily)